MEVIVFNFPFLSVPERGGGHHIDRESGQRPLKKTGGVTGGREELRSWMTAKRRERLVQFLAERDRLRKREKRPFQPPPSVSGKALHAHAHVHVHACCKIGTACKYMYLHVAHTSVS